MPTEPGVDTVAFLDATEGLVGLFDLLGSTAFGVVQNDMNGNIKVRWQFCACSINNDEFCMRSASADIFSSSGLVKKIRDRFLASPGNSETLESLVENEGKPGDGKRSATQGLLWLLR